MLTPTNSEEDQISPPRDYAACWLGIVLAGMFVLWQAFLWVWMSSLITSHRESVESNTLLVGKQIQRSDALWAIEERILKQLGGQALPNVPVIPVDQVPTVEPKPLIP